MKPIFAQKQKLPLFIILCLGLLMACDQKVNTTNDQQGDAFIDDLLQNMTLEEKIGQLNLVASSDFITGDFEVTDIGKKVRI